MLVFDEASSSVDSEVGRLIHKSLREGVTHDDVHSSSGSHPNEQLRSSSGRLNCNQNRSTDRTVLIIAHRLSSVTTSDKILVLDSGRIVENGSPPELLKASDSVYARMIAANTL